MTKDLKSLFPKASNAFLKANEKVLGAIAPDIHAADKTFTPDPPKASRRGKMNNVELEFAFILERMKRNDEISDWKFEGITLRWDSIKFTPDFAVFPSELSVSGRIKLVEVKGPFIAGNRARAVERFRHARTYWTYFDFELHQKTRDGWKRLL